MKAFKEKLAESVFSVIPITAIVLFLSLDAVPLDAGVLVLFLFGALLLIFGMGLFTIGSEMSMQPLGEGIGVSLKHSKHPIFRYLICFLLGVIITVAEPDLQVLARQIPSIPNLVLIAAVAVGVGLFLVFAMFRARKGIKLSWLLLFFYTAILFLTIAAPADFIPAAFDSGGVTTGPITVPFLIAFGTGIAASGRQKSAGENSFGLVSLCSIGPILSVLLLSIFFRPTAETAETAITEVHTTADAFRAFCSAFPQNCLEVLIAVTPILAVFLIFELTTKRFHRHQILRICIGFVYTYLGLVCFLTGANVGFMPAGRLIGQTIASGDRRFSLIPVGILIGFFVVAAEPAVHVLKKQVEEISNGLITQNAIGIGLSIGVSLSLGLSMLRVLTGISLIWFMVGGYLLSLTISFFVPPLYTAVAFDAGGVASGPMTTTFILPFAVGACEAVGGNLLTDAFGVVAMVAITPLITIQVIGLSSELRRRAARRKATAQIEQIEDGILYFETGRSDSDEPSEA